MVFKIIFYDVVWVRVVDCYGFRMKRLTEIIMLMTVILSHISMSSYKRSEWKICRIFFTVNHLWRHWYELVFVWTLIFKVSRSIPLCWYSWNPPSQNSLFKKPQNIHLKLKHFTLSSQTLLFELKCLRLIT